MNNILKQDMQEIISCPLPWENIDGRTVLISGANGFVPSYLVFSLLERNRLYGARTRVIALCRNAERAKKRFSEYLDDPMLELKIQDVRDVSALDFSGQEIDYCIHAASPAGIFSRQEAPADTFCTNVFGCSNLLELGRNCNIRRFLFLSSVDVYGKMYSVDRLREEMMGSLDPLYARNAYSNGKRAAEALCAVYRAQYNMDVVVARPFQIYGPGMSLDDGRLHGDFVGQLQSTGKIVLKSDGKAERSFIYLTDATIALFTILLKGKTGEAYNVCSETSETSVLELAKLYQKFSNVNAEIVFDHTQHQTVEVKEALPCVLGSSEKLRGLGWKASVSLEDGIRRTLQYYNI